MKSHGIAHVVCLVLMALAAVATAERPLPVLNLPDPKIAEVYRGNWENTLKPCIEPPSDVMVPKDRDSEPQRPWRVDVDAHYPGWYPGVDMKHSAAAYLACQKDLDLVLRAWKVTTERYQMPDGAIRAMTMNGNPNSVVPETTGKENVVYYPLRLTGCIDYILLGDMIFRFSQDKQWLADNIKHMELTAHYIEGWIDDEGLLDSDSYDLDQVYRQIDGVAQAAAYDAIERLQELELALDDSPSGLENARQNDSVADALTFGIFKHFFDDTKGYFAEHLTYNNIAQSDFGGSVMAVSSELDDDHLAGKAIDGIIGCGMDAFGVGRGGAGKHEWACRNEAHPWIQIQLKRPTEISQAIFLNRTDPGLSAADKITAGRLEFSDNSDPVEIQFNDLTISRATCIFRPRTVAWVKFLTTKTSSECLGNPGLAELQVLPSDEPYKKVFHGMADSNFAIIGFRSVGPKNNFALRAWHYFQDHESSFYEVNGLHAPTWIAEDTPSYTDQELNRRAPRKDCVAMGRTWRYDALMRYRMHDGDGLYKTITYANELYDRPSGGGPGFFAERYGLGRFQPGDESQANVLKYAEYPAVYNSTVVQQCLLGLDVDIVGRITIVPCVPAAWYDAGFGIENPGLLKDRDLGFTYHADRVEGWVSGTEGEQSLRVRLPRDLKTAKVYSGATEVAGDVFQGIMCFDLAVKEGERTPFVVR